MVLRASARLSLLLPLAAALRLNPAPHANAQAKATFAGQAKAALVAAVCSAQLLCVGPAQATVSPGYPSLPDAIVESSQAAYPILKALPKDTFPPFADKIGTLVLGIKPDKLAKSIDLALDMYNSVPTEKITAFNAVLKDAYGDLKPSSCDLVPLPSPAFVDKFASSEAFSKVDADRLKAFNEKWGATLGALVKTDAAICLPTSDKLDKLALAQADLGRSFGLAEAKQFNDYFGASSKTAISPGKVLPLVGEGQKQTMGASLKERQRFKAAGVVVEQAAKQCVGKPQKCGLD